MERKKYVSLESGEIDRGIVRPFMLHVLLDTILRFWAALCTISFIIFVKVYFYLLFFGSSQAVSFGETDQY